MHSKLPGSRIQLRAEQGMALAWGRGGNFTVLLNHLLQSRMKWRRTTIRL